MRGRNIRGRVYSKLMREASMQKVEGETNFVNIFTKKN